MSETGADENTEQAAAGTAKPAADVPRPPSGDDSSVSQKREVDAGAASAARGAKYRIRWWWILLAAVVIEFWVYGRRGYVDVCVGKTGETDFSLTSGPRTDDNRWKFPRCESGQNLGLISKYDAALADALGKACRGATTFRHQGEGKQCVAAEKGWEHRILTRHTPPWHPAFYEHLFWFLK